jgi:1,2-diacylglycerol 3-alpha-glucosyltransferase
MIKVFLVCSGLGRIMRGYESFAQECFEVLSSDPNLDVTLCKGGKTNASPGIFIPNLSRNFFLTKRLAASLGKKSKFSSPYFIEQATFCLGLLPLMAVKKPDVVFFSDFELGTMLWNWRRISRWPYRLLFCNGAPNGPPFSRMDHVQHVTPLYYQMALDAGEPANNHSIVPLGIHVKEDFPMLSTYDREALCKKLYLPTHRPILLSVAAINKSHKRVDYLIREVSNLAEPRPYLVMLGQFNEESQEIVELANQLLGHENFLIKTVSKEDVADYYKVASWFVLPSLTEGFGIVFLEAMSYGLPCLAHDYDVTRYVLQDQGFYANFEQVGSLTKLIHQISILDCPMARQQRHRYVYQHFSWTGLHSAYINMIKRCVETDPVNQYT